MPAYPHPLVALVVDIFEEGAEYPIVRHEFIGKTRQEAEGYFRAHQRTDTFLAGCLVGRFKNIRCRTNMYWKRLQ